jgi:hypothetical protein
MFRPGRPTALVDSTTGLVAANGKRRADLFNVNRSVMCPEEVRLGKAYDAALSAWSVWTRKNHVLAIGVQLSDARSRLRRELIDARFKTANDLYDHCVRCPDCKVARLGSFDAAD